MSTGPDGREGGFIVLHRRILSSAVWQLPALQRHVWTVLLVSANWRESQVVIRGKVLMVPRGSALIAERTLAERAGVHRNLVQRALRAFEALGMITFTDLGPGAKGGSTVRLINIVNYGQYQDVPSDDAGQPRVNHRSHQNKGNKGTRKLLAATAKPQDPIPSDTRGGGRVIKLNPDDVLTDWDHDLQRHVPRNITQAARERLRRGSL